MGPLDRIVAAARAAPRRIVLAEGEDPRILEAAIRAADEGIAEIVLVGSITTIRDRLVTLGADPGQFRIEDPQTSPLSPRLAAAYHQARGSKGTDAHAAAAALRSSLVFAAMMVRAGEADGTVGGAVATTAETVRTALQVIGPAPEAAIVSSFFLMMLCQPHHVKKGAFLFADCGLVVDPSAIELADIAITSAQSYEALTGEKARVAMLSFSTAGSASHQRVSKVIEATRLARATAPDLLIEGELQFDAAFVKAVSATKLPNTALHGEANVFIFPNLDAGNIGYKIAQRLGGANAIGPILQSLSRPANDLSRGCTANDVFYMIAITVLQAAGTVRVDGEAPIVEIADKKALAR